MSETKLVSAILEALAIEPGVVAWRNAQLTARRGGRAVRAGLGTGSADIIACVDGRFVGIEVKDTKGVLSGEQYAWGLAVREQGGVYGVAYSVPDARQIIAIARQSPRDPAANSASLSRSSEAKSRMVTRRR